MTFLCVCLKCGYNITSETIDTNHICNNVSDKAASFGKCLITIAHAMGGAQSEVAGAFESEIIPTMSNIGVPPPPPPPPPKPSNFLPASGPVYLDELKQVLKNRLEKAERVKLAEEAERVKETQTFTKKGRIVKKRKTTKK